MQFRRTLFWWKTVHRVFSDLFDRSSYPSHLRSTNLSFVATYILPLLGPSPQEFGVGSRSESYMGDDHTPIELSWVLNPDGHHTVRFTMEPLSLLDGSPSLSISWMACLKSLAQHGQIQDFDISWAQICYDHLIYPDSFDKTMFKHGSQFSVGKYMILGPLRE